jgi:hypothetical protein
MQERNKINSMNIPSISLSRELRIVSKSITLGLNTGKRTPFTSSSGKPWLLIDL